MEERHSTAEAATTGTPADGVRANTGAAMGVNALSPERMLQAMRELEIHQVELAAQNEELRNAQKDLEATRARYAELYETSPVGYATLDGDRRITSINLTGCTLLGADRDGLLMSPFVRYIDTEFMDVLHAHQQAMLASGESHECDLQMVRVDGTRFRARLTCRLIKDGDARQGCLSIFSDISDQHRSREALREAEAYASSLIHSMQDGFSVLDLNGVALDANPAFCRMTGFSKEELVGKGPPHPYWAPEEYPRIQAALESTMDGTDTNIELTFMRRNGERFPVIVSAFPVPDSNGRTVSFAATVKDITSRRQMEQRLMEWNGRLEKRVAERTLELVRSEQRFRLLTEATFEGVAISENGILVDGNPLFAAMHGTDISEMIGRPVIDFVAPESRDLVMENIRQEIAPPYEFTGMRCDGSTFPMEAHGRMMNWSGKIARVTALRDLTERKKTERKLESQRVELEQAMRLALVGEISSGIIHQLGQPLSAVGLNLEAAKAGNEACPVRNCEIEGILRDIEADLVRMRNCMKRLKALANPDESSHLPVDLVALVEKNLHFLQSEIEREGMRVEVETIGDPPWILADEVQLSQVLLNLVRNSLDACRNCPAERRIVRVTTRKLEGPGVELCVRDTGAGIPPEAIARIFNPFFTTKSEGLGIGLRISRTIVEAHGGSLEGCNNVNGPGATFRVRLPQAPQGDYTKV